MTDPPVWQFCTDPHCKHPTPHYYTRPQDGPPNDGAAEVERLRGRLAELEWAGTTCWETADDSCPACGGTQAEGHRAAESRMGPDGKSYEYPGCWLAKELGRPSG